MTSLSNRRSFVGNLALLSATLAASCGHPASGSRVHRIGFLTGAQYPHTIAAFRDELRNLGYVEGENLILEMRLSNSAADTRAQAEEVARMDVELVVAAALPTALEVRRANPDMQMVIATCPGMVSNPWLCTKPGTSWRKRHRHG